MNEQRVIPTTWPAIVEAAEGPTVLDAALAYADLGLSVIPCHGKVPALASWAARQQVRARRVNIQVWDREGILENVGVVCGRVSGNLVVMDLDGLDAFACYAREWPRLLDTYTVRSGSGQGYHLYYQVDVLPKTTRAVQTAAGNVELRADGTYVVAPPSLHPVSGKMYVVARALPIMRLPHLNDVVRWIKTLIAAKHGGAPPAATPRKSVENSTGWGIVATRNEADAVRAALPGERNNRLNLAAFKLGQIVGAGKLSRSYVESELYSAAAALAETDGEQSVLRTIKSGLDAGIRNPRR